MNFSHMPTLFLLPVLLATGIGGCGSKTPQQHLQQGTELLAKGDRQGAILELKTTLQAQPTNSEARLLLGKAYLANGAYTEAEKELRQAQTNGAPDEQVLPLLGKALLGLGQAQKVLDLGIPTHTFGPQSRAALDTSRAAALLSLDKQAEATQTIAEAEQADANYPDLLLLKARMALRKQDKTQAMQLLDSALKQDAKFNDALYLKGALMQSEGKTDEALKVFQQIVANDPKQFRAHLAMYTLHLKAKNLDAADQDIQAAEKVAAKNPMVKYARGTFELQRGNLEKASSSLLDLLRIAPDHIPTMLAYAMTSYGLGNYDMSLKNASKVLGAEPDNLFAAKILAGSQLKLGDVKGALKTLEPFLTKHAEDSKLLALAGEAYLQDKQFNKAMGYLDKAAELDPESAAIKTSQATSHLITGNSNEALADLEKAASLSDKPGQADLGLVLLLLKDREFDKALQAIASLEKKLPNNPVTHNLRAAALLGKQDRSGARNELERAIAIQPNFFPAVANLARMDMQDKKPEAARKRFQSILAADKNNVKAMLAMSDLAAAENNDKDYVGWLEKAVKADPKGLPAQTGLIRHYLSKKEIDKAMSQARQAANANPENLAAMNLLGATQLATGDIEASITTYTRMAQKAPQSPDVLLRLALAQIADKQLGTARDTLKSTLQLKPDFLKAQDALIRLELADNKPDAALSIARQIQAQQPKSPVGFDREADILMAQKHYPQAIKAYEQSLAKGAGTSGLIKLHRALTTAGDTKTADQRLAGWIKQYPSDMSVRSYAAETYMQAKRNRDAIAQYESLLKSNPDNVLVLNNLAIVYQREKDSRALATAEKALKLAPDHPGVQDTLGWILVDQGQLPRAAELLGKAAAKAPQVATIRYHYGVVLARVGKKADARKELDAAIAAGQKLPELEEAKALLKSL